MDLYIKANEAFLEDNFQESLKLYNEAVEIEPTNDLYYTGRAQVYIKLNKYTEALEDAKKALSINSENDKAYMRKGVACYYLGDFETSKLSFEAGLQFCSNEGKCKFEDWIVMCDKSILESKAAEEKKSDSQCNASSDVTSTSNVPHPQPVQPVPTPSVSKIKHDWYQTETHVVITVLVKNVKKDELKYDLQEHSLSCTISLPTGDDYNLQLDLANSIVPEQSQIKILSTKVEFKLKKVEGIRWIKLEYDGTHRKVKNFSTGPSDSDVASRYPSSSHYTRDWDKLVCKIKEEEKDEKLEGDAALNQLFQQIYSDGSDEVRKAMNKSFMESGGTVLSTNWKEIGEKPVEVKPPDGMEFKKWEV